VTKACLIIGVLDDAQQSLSPACLDHIAQADVVIGGTRTLSLFENRVKKNVITHDLTGCLADVPQWIKAAQDRNQRVVVLATGDPLCHGIGRYLIKKLGQEHCTLLPNLSMVQLACARLGLAWQQLHICSVHSHDAGEWQSGADPSHGFYPLLQAMQDHDLIAVYTSPENTPDRIARMLLSEDMQDEFSFSVAECLLRKDERIIKDISIDDAATQKFADPNIVILQRKRALPASTLFGHRDESFAQRKPDKGLITKLEVRAVSLARMQLRTDSIVWDIGAGSGSVGLEAARLCSHGYVYAIEKNEQDVAIVKQNRQRMAIHNYRIVHDKAPAQLDTWPDPDAIFIGGSGGELATLIQLCISRLRPSGWLVMNFVTLENLAEATRALQEMDAAWDVTQLQASRSQPILHMHRMQAENPVWIVSARKINSEKESLEKQRI